MVRHDGHRVSEAAVLRLLRNEGSHRDSRGLRADRAEPAHRRAGGGQQRRPENLDARSLNALARAKRQHPTSRVKPGPILPRERPHLPLTGASYRRKSSPVRDVMEFRAVAMLKCGRAGSGQLVGLTAIASIEIRASGIGRATLGDDRAGFGSAENARV